jgi:hypothetical protein
MPSPTTNTMIEKHYYGARFPDLAWSRARSAAELGYPAYVHLHPYESLCVTGCHSRVTPPNPR